MKNKQEMDSESFEYYSFSNVSLPLPSDTFRFFSQDLEPPPLSLLPPPLLFQFPPPTNKHFAAASSSASIARKRSRPQPYVDIANEPQTLQSIVQSFNSHPVMPNSEMARQRRQKISDKTRCLQKLLPWDKKMNTAKMLEEAHKYVRFLQAQVATLQTMPISSSFAQSSQYQNAVTEFGNLGRLNRQQLLQILLNSTAAQTVLSSQGFCVISYEQLLSLKNANVVQYSR